MRYLAALFFVLSLALARAGVDLGPVVFKELPVAMDANFKVGKVYDYLNDDKVTDPGGDEGLEMEQRYHNYGAVTSGQRKAKQGHYFTVSYWSKVPADVVVRFEYRQTKTKDRIQVLEVPVKSAKGWNDVRFEIIGPAYVEQGLVNSFRARVVRGGTVVAERRSFVW